MTSLKQTSFAGGLLSDKLLGHTEQERYGISLRTCTNFWITRYGTAENRPGSKYVATSYAPAAQNRLVKFVFNNQVAYLLEFVNGYAIPYRNGARISTVGAPAYSGGTAYVLGNVVTSAGATYVCIQAGTGHTPASSPTYWLVLAGDLLVLPSALTQVMLADFQTVQQNDVMTIVEQTVYPQVLTRFSDSAWTFAPFAVSTGISPPSGVGLAIGVGPSTLPAAPTGLAANGGQAATPKDNYVITAFLQGSGAGSQSAVSANAQSSAGKATGVFPVTLTWTPAAVDGYAIYKLNAINATYGIIGLVPQGVATWTDNGEFNSGLPPGDPITVPTCVRPAPVGTPGNITFRYVVTAIDSTTGAESLASTEVSANGRTPTTANPNVISWAAVAGAGSYRVYSIVGGVPGFIGTTTDPTVSFSDDNITPNTAIQPPAEIDLFSTASDYPAVVGYYQQRLAFANTLNVPTQVNMSRVGGFTNFTVSTPIQDDDAVSFVIAGQRNESVQHLVDLGKLIIHTAGSEFVANGNQGGTISPLSIGLVRQGSAGASTIPPLTLGNTDIFVQARGGFLRDLRYEIQSTSFAGKDLTVFAPDLLDGRTIVSMDWQQIPHAIIWAALDDGTLLGLTYDRAQDIWAWHEHDLGGDVEQVCVVPESTEDVVYLTVKRTIDGSVTRYIERLADRQFATIDDAWFVDCGLAYDGRNTGGTTMLLTTGAGWTSEDDLTLTASVPYFAAGNVGDAVVLQQIDDDGEITDEVTLDIIAYLSDTQVTVQADKTVPAWAQVALATWGLARHEFTGLDHLEGETVTGLGDGDVMPDAEVESGTVTYATNVLRLVVGLPITARLQTLPIENAQGETIANKKVVINELTAQFYDTRGGEYGQDFDHLQEWTQRQLEPWSDPVALYTGPVRIGVSGAWQLTGQVCIEQTDPLPIGLSAVSVSAFVGS